MNAGKIGAAVAAAAASLGLLSGCVGIAGTPKAKQVKKRPKVDLAFNVCAASPAEGSPCYSMFGPENGRLLVGFRVPNGTTVPNKFRPKKVKGEGTLLLTRSPSYTGQLNELAPKPKRARWVGYASDEVTVEELNAGEKRARFKVRFGVPKRLVGKRFKVMPVVGYTHTSEDFPAGGPVDCGDDPFDFRGDSEVDRTHCIDHPSAAEQLKNVAAKVKKKKR